MLKVAAPAVAILALGWYCCSPVPGTVCLILLVAAYSTSLFDNGEVTPGLRYWPGFTRLYLWRWLFDYFPATVEFEAADRINCQEEQYMFAVHPHGVLSLNHAMLFLESACGFDIAVRDSPRRRVDLNAGTNSRSRAVS